MAFVEKFSDGLNLVAEKVDENKYLNAIKTTFTIYLPFIIIGSFALLFNTILTSETTGLARIEFFSFLTGIAPAFNAINFATMNIMTLAIVFILGMTLAKRNKQNEMLCGLISLTAYVTVIPQSLTHVLEGAEEVIAGLPVGGINASGLFIGMILTVLVVELFSKLISFDRLRIKMPAQVPAAIANSFNALIPMMITLLITAIGGRIFVNMTDTYINEYIYEILQAPLEGLFQNPIGIMFIVFISQLFWLLGIHGGLIVSPIRNPLAIAALAANIAAVQQGLEPTQSVTMGFWMVFVVPGGAGLTLCLIIASLISSKRKDHRAISKTALLPGLFGISEPVVFGMPLILNPTFAIPFTLASVMSTGIGLFAINIGFITPNIVDVPFGIPLGLSAFLGFGLNGVIVQLIILVLGTLFYIPFVWLANRQAKLDMAQ
ncbi:PTS sugar transporter subunit IIC [Amphibacillus jilinensis]|uniref:PTS sugar transporter subunit IIC n=1 Tax=Amphibacillus jilinensis TaxID=1216008 RepID=UPI000300C1FD|nr:PTS transporter subunit EIIC [Amphibacillus jilinensis]